MPVKQNNQKSRNFETIKSFDNHRIFDLSLNLFCGYPVSREILSDIENSISSHSLFFLLAGSNFIHPAEFEPLRPSLVWETLENDKGSVFRRRINSGGQNPELGSTLCAIWLGENYNNEPQSVGIIFSEGWTGALDDENRFYQFAGQLKKCYQDLSGSRAIRHFQTESDSYRFIIDATTKQIVARRLPSKTTHDIEIDLLERVIVDSIIGGKLGPDDLKGHKPLDKWLGNIDIRKCTILNTDYFVLSFNMTNRQADKAAEFDLIIRNFSHKIRGKISALRTAASQLNLQKGQPIDDDDLALAGIIRSASESLEQLVDRLHLYSLGGGKISKRSSFDINNLVENIVSGKKENYESGPVVQFCVDSEVGSIEGDSQKIGLAINELLDNAIDASRDGDFIKIELKRNGEKISVSIINDLDQTKSTSPNSAFDFFEPFTSTVSEKSGLGLNIARRIIADHGGKIQINNETGDKLVVTFDIPAVAEKE